MKRIGITTTVPVEVLIAAGYSVIDLNNIFITSKNYKSYIDIAERDGFPKSLCGWIKGIYGACLDNGINEIIGVTGGDCSNTKGLIDVLTLKGIKVHTFAYPNERSLPKVKESINGFMKMFDVSEKQVEKVRKNLNKVRKIAKYLDQLTYLENKASGLENHIFQVSLSDFSGDIVRFERNIKEKVREIENRKPNKPKVRLAYIGVPPMFDEIYSFVEEFNCHIVYNEVQREFAFPRFESASNIFEQYYDYTYPYDINFRIEEIKTQIVERKIDAIIHYTQAFCHRAIDDIVLKNKLNIPILNIEGDKSKTLDARTKLRLEAFLDMLLDLKEMHDENTGN